MNNGVTVFNNKVADKIINTDNGVVKYFYSFSMEKGVFDLEKCNQDEGCREDEKIFIRIFMDSFYSISSNHKKEGTEDSKGFGTKNRKK